MARPRLPEKVAKTIGANIKDPQRFRGRVEPKVKSLGPAPKRFTPDQVEIWNEFNDDFPWLGRSDRRVVGLAVMLQHVIDTDPDCPVAVFAQMRMLLSAMGGTPVDRSKVQTSDDEGEDPADEYLN